MEEDNKQHNMQTFGQNWLLIDHVALQKRFFSSGSYNFWRILTLNRPA